MSPCHWSGQRCHVPLLWDQVTPAICLKIGLSLFLIKWICVHFTEIRLTESFLDETCLLSRGFFHLIILVHWDYLFHAY